jgi:hypothetical protein
MFAELNQAMRIPEKFTSISYGQPEKSAIFFPVEVHRNA